MLQTGKVAEDGADTHINAGDQQTERWSGVGGENGDLHLLYYEGAF
jgi:hypothetical protein